MSRPKGSKNKPKTPQSSPRPGLFNPANFTSGEEEEDDSTPIPPIKGLEGTTLDIYQRLPEYTARAQRFLKHEGELEEYIRENALVLLQMQRDQAVLVPITRSDISAALKSREQFVQKATELMLLIRENRKMRLEELEARNELLARGGEMPGEEGGA